MNVIEVDNISKKFRLGATTGDLRERFGSLLSRRKPDEDQAAKDFWALRDVSFSVAEGESFGIIGHNGSGKSTLLKLITGIYKPTTGTFKTRGRISALIEVGAGFHPDLTGRENVYLNGSVLGMKKREIDKRFDEIVAFSELEQFIDTPVKRYSSGMYMRLGFAVAAHVDPDIILVDEVLAVGDEAFQTKCMKRMLDLRKEGKTIVFISHSMDAVTALCQRVMLLSHGNVLSIGEPREVVSEYRTNLAVNASRSARQSNDLVSSVSEEWKKAEILDVNLKDQNGRACTQLPLGDPLTLECRFRANERITRPAFGVAIHKSDGAYIFGFNSKFDGIDIDSAEGESVFQVTFDALNMMQGLYHFTVLVYEIDQFNAHLELDVVTNAADLVIDSNDLNHGLVLLPHTWRVEEQIPSVLSDYAVASASITAGAALS